MGKVLLAYPILNFRLAHPLILIDIGGLNDLREIQEQHDNVWLGCLMTHARIEDSDAGEHWHGMLRHVARDIAYRELENSRIRTFAVVSDRGGRPPASESDSTESTTDSGSNAFIGFAP